MSNNSLPWEEEALKRLDKIPSFVRNRAKHKIEQAAIDAGESSVTVAFMDANRDKLMKR